MEAMAIGDVTSRGDVIPDGVRASGAVPVDGRTARAMRTRQAIVDACIALVEEGDLKPTAPRIAERAAVSVRSVFQHFDDLEGLFAAVGDRVLERLVGLVVSVETSIDLDRRLAIVARQRAALLEAVTPIRRATALVAWSSPEVRSRLAAGHQFLRSEVGSAFAPEIDRARRSDGDDAAAELLDALDVACSWSTWEQMRSQLGLDHDAAVAVLERLLAGLLDRYRPG